ncbi:hypothetical protein F4809DRAFT_636992 [Biscogniauxia mediterranea]|nr:hypothetical protein F4809DRAFT_636992 [Biscogniauxia mediterranea]
MPDVPGTLVRSGPNRITALFIINGFQATYNASTNPALQLFTANDVTLTYNKDGDLENTHSFEGHIGVDDFELALDNGAVIKGKVNAPGVTPASTINGSGSWGLSSGR